jgi:hypothetical protein
MVRDKHAIVRCSFWFCTYGERYVQNYKEGIECPICGSDLIPVYVEGDTKEEIKLKRKLGYRSSF